MKKFLLLCLSFTVGFVVSVAQFGGIDWSGFTQLLGRQPSETPLLATSTPVTTLVAANDTSGAFTLDGDASKQSSTATNAPLPGRHAPDFVLTSFEGQRVALADYRGQRVFVNFWASWCIPCRDEASVLEAAYRRYVDFVVLGVNILDTTPDALAFADEFGLTFPLLHDENERVMNAYRIRALPTSFVVDREGIIRFVHVGPLTEEAITRYLSEMP